MDAQIELRPSVIIYYVPISQYIVVPLFIVIPSFGVWFVIIISEISIPSSTFIFICSPKSFNIFSASFTFMFVILGTVTSVTGSNSSVLSFSSSKYGNTSDNICEPIGAATPPPWLIITTQKL